MATATRWRCRWRGRWRRRILRRWGRGRWTRTSADKFSDLVSVKDFGAVGDGTTDDLLAFQKALAAHDSVLVPNGIYLISGTVSVGDRKALLGTGQKSVIQAQSNDFAAIELRRGYARVQDLRIEGGAHGILHERADGAVRAE